MGLPFEKDSYINKLGDHFISRIEKTDDLIEKLPNKLNTKIVGTETSYDLYDLEVTYWSNGTLTYRQLNIRPQVILNKYD